MGALFCRHSFRMLHLYLAVRFEALSQTSLPNFHIPAYLQAFAERARLRILTFDRALAKAAGGECLLGQ